MISRQNYLFLIHSILFSLSLFSFSVSFSRFEDSNFRHANQSFSSMIYLEREKFEIDNWIFLPLLHLFPFLSFVRILITYHISTIRLPIYLPTYLSTCLPACLPSFLPIYLPAYLLTFLPTHLPTDKLTCLSDCPFTCTSICSLFRARCISSRIGRYASSVGKVGVLVPAKITRNSIERSIRDRRDRLYRRIQLDR